MLVIASPAKRPHPKPNQTRSNCYSTLSKSMSLPEITHSNPPKPVDPDLASEPDRWLNDLASLSHHPPMEFEFLYPRGQHEDRDNSCDSDYQI